MTMVDAGSNWPELAIIPSENGKNFSKSSCCYPRQAKLGHVTALLSCERSFKSCLLAMKQTAESLIERLHLTMGDQHSDNEHENIIRHPMFHTVQVK
jgi:hypothetical protein